MRLNQRAWGVMTPNLSRSTVSSPPYVLECIPCSEIAVPSLSLPTTKPEPDHAKAPHLVQRAPQHGALLRHARLRGRCCRQLAAAALHLPLRRLAPRRRRRHGLVRRCKLLLEPRCTIGGGAHLEPQVLRRVALVGQLAQSRLAGTNKRVGCAEVKSEA